jgi:processive 1,2-diacylglycerol beta-glucosyltransferase
MMVHASWVEPGIERYTAATSEVIENTIAKGAPADRIVLTGLPVSRRFGNVTIPRVDLRNAFGLDPEKFTVLAIGGGEGAGSLGEMMEYLWASNLDVQTVVVTGRAEALRRRLESVAPPGNIVLGFTKIMPELMHLADVVVTKGGPQTIGEALCSRRPIIITQCLPGQEQGNDAFVENHGVGFAAQSPDRLVLYLEALIAEPAARERISKMATVVARPGAADAVAAVCGDVLGITDGALARSATLDIQN